MPWTNTPRQSMALTRFRPWIQTTLPQFDLTSLHCCSAPVGHRASRHTGDDVPWVLALELAHLATLFLPHNCVWEMQN